MVESILIKAQNNAIIFTDAYDKGLVWLSIQTPSGSMHCTMTHKTAQELIDALKVTMEQMA